MLKGGSKSSYAVTDGLEKSEKLIIENQFLDSF